MTSRYLMRAALAPIVILLASATRLILISGYDTATATALATSGGLGQTLLGTVVPLLPPFLPAAVVLLALVRQWFSAGCAAAATLLISPAYASQPEGLTHAGKVVRLVWHDIYTGHWASISQDSQLLGYCLALGVLVAISDSLDRLSPVQGAILLLPRIVAVTLAATFALSFAQAVYRVPFDLDSIAAAALRKPWQPTEEITTTSGEIHVGYVLGTTPGWYTILDERKRTISYLQQDDIKARAVCRVGPSAADLPLPLKSFNIERTDVPPCVAPSG